jgi:hypothetical protein
MRGTGLQILIGDAGPAAKTLPFAVKNASEVKLTNTLFEAMPCCMAHVRQRYLFEIVQRVLKFSYSIKYTYEPTPSN